eukprot:TRINITY_DN169_c0_g1_i1.p1 TRINITY_DN169_c0_g1~~TRINITY_DN169_c0_g1_i1.p1  ORF type:complete len:161 (+),score=47.31 TRINITY_DN169_c0_g1_i1:96-578(+)
MSTKKKVTKQPEPAPEPVAAPVEEKPASTESAEASEDPKKELTPGTIVPVRGRNVSGRNWKGPKERYGVINTTPSLKTSWDKKQAQREKMVQLRQRNAAIKEQADLARQQLAEKIKANKERRAKNEIKSAQYQVVKNTSKLRKMSRKQMQQFKKLADIAK